MSEPNLVVTVLPASIHVGDVGTIYRGRITGINPPFDPLDTGVDVQLIFSLPNGIVLTKVATIEAAPDAGSPVDAWRLEYQVQGDDGTGSPAGVFHADEGAMRIQAALRWLGSGSPSAEELQWHSDVATVDSDGQELRIFPNLA